MTITIDDVLREARALDGARMNPTVVLDDAEFSVYTAADGTHCIVGEIGTRLGLAMPAHGDADNAQPWTPMAAARGLDVDSRAAWALATLQSGADYGNTWGDALDGLEDWLTAEAYGAPRGGAT